LVRRLADHGLDVYGGIDDLVPFDPVRHEVLSGVQAEAGTPVRIRLLGASVGPRVVSRAGVEPERQSSGRPHRD
jgi:hypothetical protein